MDSSLEIIFANFLFRFNNVSSNFNIYSFNCRASSLHDVILSNIYDAESTRRSQ